MELMNRPTAWPSFAEYGAFEKETNWMEYVAVLMSVFAYKELHLFHLSLHLEVGTKDNSKSVPQMQR